MPPLLPRKPLLRGDFEAERAGFEPATHLSASTRFPVALLRPLGHLSAPRDIVPHAARPSVVQKPPLHAARDHDDLTGHVT